MKFYLDNNFKLTIYHLEKATKIDHSNGRYFLYLGVSYYLNQQPKPAIKSLMQADTLTKGTLSTTAKWYLAQSYLLNNQPQKAITILEYIKKRNRNYSAEASVLLSKLN